MAFPPAFVHTLSGLCGLVHFAGRLTTEKPLYTAGVHSPENELSVYGKKKKEKEKKEGMAPSPHYGFRLC